MSSFLADLLSKFGMSLISGIAGWVRQWRLEQQAKKAEELEERLLSIRQGRERDEALRQELKNKAEFSYAAWEAQK